MTPASDKLKAIKVQPTAKARKSPLWDGPGSDTKNGGVTQGLIARWLVCRERTRLYLVEGLRVSEGFNHRLYFGSAWHVCEEALAAGVPTRRWEADLMEYGSSQCKVYPFSQEQVAHWTEVVRVTFPQYIEYWSKHPDTISRTPLLQEQVFSVPYKLPSGRVVYLKGKWDSVDLIGQGKGAGVYLGENKTKGNIDENQIKRQLSFDLQTMLYLVALCEPSVRTVMLRTPLPILGVRYNVVRRPLSGGKGNIVRHKPTKGSKCQKCKGDGGISEHRFGQAVLNRCGKCGGTGRVNAKPGETSEAFYKRVGAYIKAEPESYFMRWTVNVLPSDVDRFRRECLDPVLEGLCQWWDMVSFDGGKNPWGEPMTGLHFRMPYGVRSPLLDGGYDDMDALLDTGSTVGMTRTEEIFPELSEGG